MGQSTKTCFNSMAEVERESWAYGSPATLGEPKNSWQLRMFMLQWYHRFWVFWPCFDSLEIFLIPEMDVYIMSLMLRSAQVNFLLNETSRLMRTQTNIFWRWWRLLAATERSNKACLFPHHFDWSFVSDLPTYQSLSYFSSGAGSSSIFGRSQSLPDVPSFWTSEHAQF